MIGFRSKLKSAKIEWKNENVKLKLSEKRKNSLVVHLSHSFLLRSDLQHVKAKQVETLKNSFESNKGSLKKLKETLLISSKNKSKRSCKWLFL